MGEDDTITELNRLNVLDQFLVGSVDGRLVWKEEDVGKEIFFEAQEKSETGAQNASIAGRVAYKVFVVAVLCDDRDLKLSVGEEMFSRDELLRATRKVIEMLRQSKENEAAGDISNVDLLKWIYEQQIIATLVSKAREGEIYDPSDNYGGVFEDKKRKRDLHGNKRKRGEDVGDLVMPRPDYRKLPTQIEMVMTLYPYNELKGVASVNPGQEDEAHRAELQRIMWQYEVDSVNFEGPSRITFTFHRRPREIILLGEANRQRGIVVLHRSDIESDKVRVVSVVGFPRITKGGVSRTDFDWRHADSYYWMKDKLEADTLEAARLIAAMEGHPASPHVLGLFGLGDGEVKIGTRRGVSSVVQHRDDGLGTQYHYEVCEVVLE